VPISSEVANAAVRLPAGVDLHARPAANFVRTAMGFSADITVARSGRDANAKSLLGLLALGARRGTELRLRASGEDAAAAVAALTAAVAGFSE
jgi:phosphotransferase system HPr (HPr) family protein